MDSNHEQARQMLNKARAAVSQGQHQLALESYAWFFEHALDGDGASFYGVRLSYCLEEWARLSEIYAPAKKSLEERFKQCLVALEHTGQCEHFHDYLSIGEYLGRSDEVFQKFLEYHHSRRTLAAAIVSYIWDALAESEHVAVGGAYIDDLDALYSLHLQKFDGAMRVCRSDPQLGGEEFAEQIIGWFHKDVSNLMKVLVACGRQQDAARIGQTAEKDLS
jgi:hypothetical protein